MIEVKAETDRCISCEYRMLQLMSDTCPKARLSKRSKSKICASYVNRHLRSIINKDI